MDEAELEVGARPAPVAPSAAPEPAAAPHRPIARVLPLLEPAHLDRDFDYLVPAELDAIAQPGVRVRVRFSGRLVDGYLLERLEHSEHTGRLMRLERVVSGEQVLTSEILRLVTAVAARYAGTRADVLRLAVPPRHAKVEGEAAKKAVLATESIAVQDGSGSGPDAGESGADGEYSEAGVTGAETTAAHGVSESAGPGGSGVEADGIGEASTEAGGSGVAVAADGSGPVGDPRADSTGAQDVSRFSAWSRYRHGMSFLQSLSDGKGPRAAWQAVPGEDWARRLAELAGVVVAGGRSAVLMVPDQRDLDRVLAACVEVVGEAAVGLSAGLGPAARYRRWLSVLRGAAQVVVGTRSSVFAPARDLGLIAIWDDGDDTYAEPRSPYPHGREVAMLRAHETGAAFVVGGFARTAEAQAIVESGWAHDLVADRAELRACAPRISAPGDTDVALERDPVARAVRIPGVAFTAARRALAAGEPVLVQVPRRGYVPALSCAKCRTPARCRHCNGPLALPDNSSAVHGPDRGWSQLPGGEPGSGAGDGPSRSSVRDRGGSPSGGTPDSRAGSRDWERGSAPSEVSADSRLHGGGRGRGGAASGGMPDPRRSSARELGVALSRSASGEVAHSPACRWCGKIEAAFRCPACGSRALRAVVIGAARTAEELGRAFPGVPIRGSGGKNVLNEVPAGPQVVVSTIGAEPVVPGGYGVGLLLDGWALLGRADLRAAEDTLRRWMSAAALVRRSGQVIVMAEPSLPTVQALVRWDPVGHAAFELAARAEVSFPPTVRLAALDGTADSVAELLSEAQLPPGTEILGPVPLPPGARKPFSAGESPAEVERMILRTDRSQGPALSRALTAALAVRSTRKQDAPLRVQIDPLEIG